MNQELEQLLERLLYLQMKVDSIETEVDGVQVGASLQDAVKPLCGVLSFRDSVEELRELAIVFECAFPFQYSVALQKLGEEFGAMKASRVVKQTILDACKEYLLITEQWIEAFSDTLFAMFDEDSRVATAPTNQELLSASVSPSSSVKRSQSAGVLPMHAKPGRKVDPASPTRRPNKLDPIAAGGRHAQTRKPSAGRPPRPPARSAPHPPR